MTDQTAGLPLTPFSAAAEHAGRWKAERGRAPHYATVRRRDRPAVDVGPVT
ncbi:hypothetical protein [Streptomyces rochei]|uniref:hypothetical protein n=1 Tax=Streptomyces rochei TaxID=1928 RepID=UPI003641E425